MRASPGPSRERTAADGRRSLPPDSFFYGGEVSPPARTDIISVWIPLVPVGPTTGALRLVRGSHRHGKLPLEFGAWQAGEWVQDEQEMRRYGELVCEEMQPGDGECQRRQPHASPCLTRPTRALTTPLCRLPSQ